MTVPTRPLYSGRFWNPDSRTRTPVGSGVILGPASSYFWVVTAAVALGLLGTPSKCSPMGVSLEVSAAPGVGLDASFGSLPSYMYQFKLLS